VFFLAQVVSDRAGIALTAVLTVPITQKGSLPAFEDAQADADLTVGDNQTSTSIYRNPDQLDRITLVRRVDRSPSISL
jgi:hypothetical protein